MYRRDFEHFGSDKNNILSVVLMTDSFFYSIFDSQNSLILHKSYTNIRFSKPEDLMPLHSDYRLKESFSKISVMISDGHFFHLPEKDDSLIEVIPGLEHVNQKEEKFIGENILTYFGISHYQENLLIDLFGLENYELHHISNVFAAYYYMVEKPLVHVHVDESVIHIYVQKNKAFTFYNRFEKNDYKSVLYFNLAILEEQGLISKECTLILTGWIDKDSALYSLLRTYLDNITIPEIPMINQNREIKEDLKLHYYFDHIANILCAS